MKPQDIIFFVTLAILLFLRKPKLFIIFGLLCFLISIPLFQFHIFFTAQRLVMYGAGFIFIAILFMIMEVRKEK